MGIQGLERYLLTKQDSCPTVSIEELVKEYKSKTGKSEAVGVVDGGMLMYHVMGRLDLKMGGQFKEFGENLVAFARRLEGVGTSPVFFFKGMPSEGRQSTWVERKEKEAARAVAVYAQFNQPAQHATPPAGDQADKLEPTGDQPEKTQPAGDQPDKLEPTGDQPEQTQPAGDQPDKAEPAGDQPDKLEPTGDQPEQTQPAGDQSDKLEPTSDQPEKTQPACDQQVKHQAHVDQPGTRGRFAPRGRGAVRGRRQLLDRTQPQPHRPQAPRAPTHGYLLPPATQICAALVLKTAGYEVHYAVEELDVEVARYARRHGCFCILSRDTDFVALEGAMHYLSLGHLDETSMRTVCFDRDAIACALGLRHRRQLPLLLALLPNGCVPAQYLIPLHLLASGGRKDALSPKLFYRLENVVKKLGELVRTELWGKSVKEAAEIVVTKALAPYPKETLTRFSKELKFANSWALREALRVQLEASLRAHDYSPADAQKSNEQVLECGGRSESVDPEVVELALTRHRSLDFASPCVLGLLLRQVIEQSPALEDPALPARCGSTAALLPFRRRAYGILLKDSVKEGSPPVVVREFILPNSVPPGTVLQPQSVQPIVPGDNVPHPGLKSLWTCADESESSWRLFVWCLCPGLQSSDAAAVVHRLRSLPPALCLAAAALFLLKHTGALAASRAEADLSEEELLRRIATTCVLVRQLSAEQVRSLPSPRCARLAVHVAALFMQTWSYLVILNDILGAPVSVHELYPPGVFDGKLWQCVFGSLPIPHEFDVSVVDSITRIACQEDGKCEFCTVQKAEKACQ